MQKFFILIIAGFFITIALMSFESYRNIQSIQQQWNNYLEQVDHRQEVLSEIKENLGYSGFIHHFKNFVLRRQNRYLNESRSHMDRIKQLVQSIKHESILTPLEKQQLLNIEMVVNNYEQALNLAEANPHKMTPKQLDAIVKVDDTPAAEAFRWFRENHKRIRSEYRSHFESSIKKSEVTLGITTLIASVIFLSLAHFSFLNLKKSYDTIQKAKTELRFMVKEMEEFTYVVSHDLQAPLRHITSFVEKIRKRVESSSDPDINKWADFIQTASHRMKILIQDLLAYSRTGRSEVKFQSSNIEELLSQCVAHIDTDIQNNNAEIQMHNMKFKLHLNKLLLTQLFQNLIENSMKFRKASESPKIIIEAIDKRDEVEFVVSDNGIGINPEYQAGIFRVFQRLHHKDEYDGTGIGLAIAKKIVEIHNGRIWVVSTPGEGSHFHFTISKNLNNLDSKFETRFS